MNGSALLRGKVVLFRGGSYHDEKQKVVLMPLSLMSLAPVLPACRPIILDGNLSSEAECFRRIEKDLEDVLCVGISALTGAEIASGLRFAAMIRSANPDIPIIWGGWHVSCLPEESLQNSYVDAVVVGIGQKAFPQIVERLQRGETYDDIPGVSTVAKDGTVKSSPRQKLIDLSDCPLPDFEGLDLERYRQESLLILPYPAIGGIKLTGYLYYVTSFGCPYACRFCSNDTLYRHCWSGYSIDAVVNQLEWLIRDRGFNCIGFIDAEFFFKHDRVEHFCREVIARGLRFVWDAQASVKSILRLEEKGLLPKLREAGCWRMNIGVESGSAEMLRYMNKGISVQDALRCAQALKTCGIVGCFNFLFGLPPEKESHLHESFALAYRLKKINPDSPLPVSFYSPLPGNPIYADSVEAGFRPPAGLEAWGRYEPSYTCLSHQVPWRKPHFEKLIYDVLTFYLPMAVPGNLMRGTITRFKYKLKHSNSRLLLGLAGRLAAYRLRHCKFGFRFERAIFDIYRTILKRPVYRSGRWDIPHATGDGRNNLASIRRLTTSSGISLETDRTSLRPLKPCDVVDDYVNGLNDPEVNEFLVDVRRQRQSRKTVVAFVRDNLRSQKVILFGIFLKDTGKLVGTVKISEISWFHYCCSVGVCIFDKAKWGSGYATEALSRIVQFIFEELGLHYVEAGVYEENVRSVKLFQGLSFDVAGIFRDKYRHVDEFRPIAMFRRVNPYFDMGLLKAEVTDGD